MNINNPTPRPRNGIKSIKNHEVNPNKIPIAENTKINPRVVMKAIFRPYKTNL